MADSKCRRGRAVERVLRTPDKAQRCHSSPPAVVAAALRSSWEPLELGQRRSSVGGEEPRSVAWVAGQPTAAAALLARCLEAGVVSQETLDSACRNPTCFVKFSEMEKIANIQAEINEKKLEIEILQMEKDTADIAHHFYLGQKLEILQDMNRHLETVLKNKKALRKRLIKARCEDSLPIEATFHKSVVDLLAEAATFIDKLESYLQTVRSIPEVPSTMKNMDAALTKTELLVMDLEELTDRILQWRERQKEVYSDSICSAPELDFI